MSRIGWNDGTRILLVGDSYNTMTTSVTPISQKLGTVFSASITNIPKILPIETRRDRRRNKTK